MMFKGKHFFIALLVALFVSACIPKASRECPLPPKEFIETDLIGTWDAIGDQGNNTLIIGGDGRYKQIMNVEWQGFKYESDWNSWRVTYSDRGLPYLHLEGLLMCAYWRQIDCRTGQTGITPVVVGDTKDPFASVYYWYDGCQKRWVDTPGEGVFMVFGTSEYYARKINLVPFTKSSDSPTGPSYKLRAP